MTFLLIYLLGVFIAIIITVRYAMKEFNFITIGDIAFLLAISLFSWFVVFGGIVSIINWDRQIWKRKK